MADEPRALSAAARSWPGFGRPTYTMVPDDLLDDLMADLSGAELKVVLYIIRRTIGWRREADAISLSQLTDGITRADGTRVDRGTGLSRPACIAAVKALVGRGIISADRQHAAGRHDTTIYRLIWRDGSKETLPPLVKKYDYPGKEIEPGGSKEMQPGVVNGLYPQQTALQQTALQQIDMPSSSADDDGAAIVAANGSGSEPVPPRRGPGRPRKAPPPADRRAPRKPEECATWEPAAFARAWEYYGKRGDVGEAGAAWDWLKPTRDDMAVMKRAMASQRVAYGWGEPDGQIQPYFSTFIRRGDWQNVDPRPGRVRA